MDIFSLIYVSRSLIDPSASRSVVDAIVEASDAKNRLWQITGSLIFTGDHFAQYIEGSQESVAALIDLIRRDPRHTEITVITETTRQSRIFPDWSLAYVGPSAFVSRVVTRPIRPAGGYHSEGVSDLIALMRVFADHPSTKGSIFSQSAAES